MPFENRICADCIEEKFLRNEITNSAQASEQCSYCGKARPTIELLELAEKLDKVFSQFYEPTNSGNDLPWDHEPEGNSLDDVLDSLLGTSDQVRADLAELLSELWFERDTMEHQYGEDPYFVEQTQFEQPLSDAWKKMEQSLKSEARLINPTAALLLEKVFGPILTDRTYDERAIIVEVGPGLPIDHFYRARVFQTEHGMEEALSHPERYIGPPPSEVAVAGRMNAKGISVFYGATKKNIAIAEIRPPVGSYAVMAKFDVTRPLRLLDIYELRALTVDPGMSFFDPHCAEATMRSQFLGTLANKMVMPVMPELQDRDYLITQVIADFLATHPELLLDGILFPSAQRALTSQHQDGRNVILFNKASKVVRADRPQSRVSVHLWDIDEDGARFEPGIFSEPEVSQPASRLAFLAMSGSLEPALELDRNALEIFEIKNVSYGTFSHDVKHQVRETPSARKPKT